MGCNSSADSRGDVFKGKENIILLLGVGGVGKSTVFKQLKMLYTSGFTEEEKTQARLAIAHQMVAVLMEMVNFGVQKGFLKISAELEASNMFFESLPSPFGFKDKELIQQISDNITLMWGLPEVKKSFIQLKTESNSDKKSEALLDWADYFLDKHKSIFNESIPISDDDVVKLRRETSGAQKMSFIYNKEHMQMIDFGGQTHERGTWESEFEDCLAIIYMVSLADYDVVTQGKSGGNRLTNAIKVFQDLSENIKLQNTPFVVLLNKSDIFKRKILDVGINVAFPDVHESINHNAEKAFEYISSVFIDFPRKIKTSVHITNATDTKLIDTVFDKITQGVLNLSLAKAGLD